MPAMKKKFYDRDWQYIWTFHGTTSYGAANIMEAGFKIEPVFNKTDGANRIPLFGHAIYTSPYPYKTDEYVYGTVNTFDAELKKMADQEAYKNFWLGWLKENKETVKDACPLVLATCRFTELHGVHSLDGRTIVT